MCLSPLLTFSPFTGLYRPPWTPPFGARYRLPSLPLSAPVNGLNDDRHRRSPSPYSLWFSHLHIKRWRCIRGRLRKWSQIISAHAGYFYFRISGINHFIFVVFVTVEFGENWRFAANLAPETMLIHFFFLTGMPDVNSDSSDADSASVAMSLTATILWHLVVG